MRLILPMIALLAVTGCHSAPKQSLVDTIYHNGVIWTGVEGDRGAKVLAIDDGKIAFVGEEIPAHLASNTTVNLKGRFVMPGFQDNHVHFMEGGAALASVDLRDAKTPDEFSRRIAAFASGLPAGRWVLNGNWDQTNWGGELPHKGWIDAETDDTPVYVIRIDGHMALANSAALREAGVTSATPNPDGGEIVRGADGEPTGILRGNALNMVLAAIPPPTDDELMEQFARAQEHALSLGLTKIHAVTAYPTETNMLDIFKMARERGLLEIRAQVSTPIESWQTVAAEVRHEGRGDDMLRWGGVKGFVDGSLGARTAWFHEPYSDETDEYGQPLNDLDELASWMEDAANAGLELSIHAIGDRGVDWAQAQLAKIQADNHRGRRLRIEHFQHPTQQAIATLAKNGLIASMQPYHAIDDGRWAGERIGVERLKTTYAFRSVLDQGGYLTFGSDWPVAPLSPLKGVYAAVTRRTVDGANPEGWLPEQKISVEEALTAYTVTNAYAFGEEDVAGTLEFGKRADFVVLSSDPRKLPPEEIGNIVVERTVIAGDVVYEDSARAN